MWQKAGGCQWEPLQDAAHFPGFPESWDVSCPEGFSGMCPPFLTALPEPGLLQVSLGLIATASPGWLLYMRPAANFPSIPYIEGFVGIVDAEAYQFGPIFTNLRLCKTDTAIAFPADRPLVQLSAVPRQLLTADAKLRGATPIDISGWTSTEWEGYRQTVLDPNSRLDRRYGEYATRARKLAAGCPAHGRAA